MWPIVASELLRVLAPVTVSSAEQSRLSTLGECEFFRAISWLGASLGPGDLFFVIHSAQYSAVPEVARKSGLTVVAADWTGYQLLAPELRARCLRVSSPLHAYRLLAGHLRKRFTFPVIAVGGSNGKTTTKDMVVAILSAGGRRVTATPGTNNGWSGVPVTLCQSAHRRPAPDALVIEIGIDERGAMREHVAIVEPDVAIITSLGAEHLAGLGSIDDVVREELDLFAGAKRRVWLADEPHLAKELNRVRAGDLIVAEESSALRSEHPVLGYTWSALSAAEGSLRLTWEGHSALAHMNMPALHNGRNAALAIGAALACGRSLEEAVGALANFRGPAQRCEVRGLASGCIVVDDSYNANPSSFAAALDVVSGFDPGRQRVLVLGDMLDLGSATDAWHREVAESVTEVPNAHVRLYGEKMLALAPLLTAAASVGVALPPEDPGVLIDIPGLEESVVLVKGSRGMRLERVVQHLVSSEHRTSREDDIGVGVVGDRASDIASAIRASAAAVTSKRRIFVRALDRSRLERGEARLHPYHLAVLSGLSLSPEDPERDLAAIAQLFLETRSIAIIQADPVAAEGAELIAGIVPPNVSVRRTSEVQLMREIASAVACLLRV